MNIKKYGSADQDSKHTKKYATGMLGRSHRQWSLSQLSSGRGNSVACCITFYGHQRSQVQNGTSGTDWFSLSLSFHHYYHFKELRWVVSACTIHPNVGCQCRSCFPPRIRIVLVWNCHRYDAGRCHLGVNWAFALVNFDERVATSSKNTVYVPAESDLRLFILVCNL